MLCKCSFDFRDVPTAPFYPPPPRHPTSTAGHVCRGICPAEQEWVRLMGRSRHPDSTRLRPGLPTSTAG
jgi:hypothetical protein